MGFCVARVLLVLGLAAGCAARPVAGPPDGAPAGGEAGAEDLGLGGGDAAPSSDALSVASDARPADTEPADAVGPDARALASEAGVDGGGQRDAGVFVPGLLGSTRPVVAALQPLPGRGVGDPVLTSNNPELLTGAGLLYGNARPLSTRGGRAYPLSGSFGVYLHHLVDTDTAGAGGGPPLWITLLVTNPGATDVTVDVRGSGYTQGETGGLALGSSPDYRVSAEWIRREYDVVTEGARIAPGRPLVAWQRRVEDRQEVDGRFGLRTNGPVYVYVVATRSADVNDCVRTAGAGGNDAPGDYRISGDPPPPFGREAGIYAHDTWLGEFEVSVPAGPAHAGWVVNTATGQSFSQVQAFPALTHLDGSAREAVGMYGNVYDLALRLRHGGPDQAPRAVRVVFWSLSTGALSRYYDGLALVDGRPLPIQHVPAAPSTVLVELSLGPGETRDVRLQAMVPGLTSISQALTVESR